MIGIVESIGLGIGATFLMNLFMDSKDSHSQHSEIKSYREFNDLKGKGLTISNNIRISDEFSNEHVLIVAPSGAGKSYRVVRPNVNRLSEEKCTLIVTDPKCEIEKYCKSGNKKVLVLNPYSKNTICYDPIRNCRNTTEVRKIADLIMSSGSAVAAKMSNGGSDNGDWVKKATIPLKAYMLWNYRSKRYTFPKLVQRLLNDFGGVVEEIMKSNVEDAKILMNSFLPVTKSPTTFACIRNTMLDCLELFLDESVIRLMSGSNIDLSKLRHEETILYIQIPEKDAEYFSPITSVFVTQMFDRLLDNKDGLQTYMLFDEFANIGCLGTNLPNVLSTCRSRRISVTACIQSLNQIELVYEKSSKTLNEMFKTIVFMAGLKDSTEYASKLTGVRDNEGHIEQLLTPDQVRRLDKKDCLVISANKFPVIDRLYR